MRRCRAAASDRDESSRTGTRGRANYQLWARWEGASATRHVWAAVGRLRQHGQQTGAGRPLAVDPIRLAPDNEPVLWSPPMRVPWPRPSLRLRRRLALGSLVAEEGAEGEWGLMTLTREREEPKTQSRSRCSQSVVTDVSLSALRCHSSKVIRNLDGLHALCLSQYRGHASRSAFGYFLSSFHMNYL
jgi:hypothetical protein